jgi:formamidopyrimidine-DNA glycosylase
MPELPEVETLVRQIRTKILNHKIVDVTVDNSSLRLINNNSPDIFAKQIIGKSIRKVSRHGKYICLYFDNYSGLVIHLRMSGYFLINDKGKSDNKHVRIQLAFEKNLFLDFIDIRKFATFHYTTNINDYFSNKNLGVDALSNMLTTQYLYGKLNNSRLSIYKSLLNQNILMGLGNIYVNEVLHASRIMPTRLTNNIKYDEVDILIQHTSNILNRAIDFQGTTLIDKSFKNITGDYGNYSKLLKVYGRHDQNCINCNNKIHKIKISGRSVYYCSYCQK